MTIIDDISSDFENIYLSIAESLDRETLYFISGLFSVSGLILFLSLVIIYNSQIASLSALLNPNTDNIILKNIYSEALSCLRLKNNYTELSCNNIISDYKREQREMQVKKMKNFEIFYSKKAIYGKYLLLSLLALCINIMSSIMLVNIIPRLRLMIVLFQLSSLVVQISMFYYMVI